MMLHQNPSRRSALLKYGLSAPLFVAMLILTSATVSEQKTIKIISDKISSDATVKEVAKEIGNPTIVLPKPPASFKTSFTIGILKAKVVGINGEPLAGVKILYTKKNTEFTTDKDGDFKIPNYIEGDLLTFEYDGLNTVAKSFNYIKGKLPIVVLQGSRSAIASANTINKNPANGEPVSFAVVDKLPTFPGGNEAFGKYLSKSLRYPKIAKDENIQGRVIASFIVEKDGKLNDIKVLRDIGGGCGIETIRVLSESPAWNPGTIKGEPVRVAYTMPISFTLAGTKKDSTANGVKLNNIAITGQALLDTTKTMDAVRINGNTFSNKALVIIDGIEAKGINPLESINPNDIERVDVLKGASATAKYGDKAKDGVIEIILKKAKKP